MNKTLVANANGEFAHIKTGINTFSLKCHVFTSFYLL